MNLAIAGTICAGDHALRVDMEGDGEIGSRRVDGSKRTVAQQKTVKSAAAVNISPHDVALRVDSIRDGINGSRNVDLCKRWLARLCRCLQLRRNHKAAKQQQNCSEYDA